MLRLLLCLLLLSAPAHADEIAGMVFAVIDGDTVLFRADAPRTTHTFFKLRLADIDAPESAQPGGEAATRALTGLALKRRAMADIRAVDRYGRQVGRLSVDGVDAGTMLVRDGLAWASRIHPDYDLLALERVARTERRGLWAESRALPPWRWRATHPNPAHAHTQAQKHISE